MEQAGAVTVAGILEQTTRFGVHHVAGPLTTTKPSGVEIVAFDDLAEATPGCLVVAALADGRPVRSYQVDIAVRRAIAAGSAALLLIGEVPVAHTVRVLAERAGLPVLTGPAPASELAVAIDRILRGGAAEALTRAGRAIELAGQAATRDSGTVLQVAGAALGVTLTLADDPSVTWAEPDAVCVGEVPVGRLVTDQHDSATDIALPVVAALLSRAVQRELADRFGPARSRADLIIELVFADSARLDGFATEAVRAGLPLQLSHAVAWLTPTPASGEKRRPPAVLAQALELRTLQITESRDELWHLAVFRDDAIVVASEEIGAPDHQRRLREVVEDVVAHVSGDGWTYTAGLGTPAVGAAGMRQSATEARIAAETAVAGGRAGSITVTDVTGLRRVLLDFYASPLSRALLDDILSPLDELGPERATEAMLTLRAYLGHRNSLARAGAELNLHPNAVNYRIRRIEKTLRLDLGDPDVRFAVELACRVRLIAPGR
ncbi:PucR family transcriptional regulator [Kineosporia mesophila]|nr:PucR family transcriptional regulator [Kineosporia mesophila]MCD5352868.1 helix-turn-helix domain-containing protein [Kineosporia mesophila]